jgi:hypothetical protein
MRCATVRVFVFYMAIFETNSSRFHPPELSFPILLSFDQSSNKAGLLGLTGLAVQLSTKQPHPAPATAIKGEAKRRELGRRSVQPRRKNPCDCPD